MPLWMSVILNKRGVRTEPRAYQQRHQPINPVAFNKHTQPGHHLAHMPPSNPEEEVRSGPFLRSRFWTDWWSLGIAIFQVLYFSKNLQNLLSLLNTKLTMIQRESLTTSECQRRNVSPGPVTQVQHHTLHWDPLKRENILNWIYVNHHLPSQISVQWINPLSRDAFFFNPWLEILFFF